MSTAPPPMRVGKTFVEFDVVVCNDDFNTDGTNIPWLMHAPPPRGKKPAKPRRQPALSLGQEGKAENYRKELNPKTFGVTQDVSTDALAGSFQVWRRDIGMRPGAQYFRFACDGGDLLTRYLAGKHYRPGNIADLSALAGHRPPQRDEHLWPEWDRNVIAEVHRLQSLHRWILLGTDFNAGSREALPFAHKAGLVWHSTGPRRIDGLFTSPGIKVSNIQVLPKRTSDHNPLQMTVRIPAGKPKR